jgi:hypothetical protein
MVLGMMKARNGIRRAGAVVAITVAANAGAVPLYQVSNWAHRIGVSTVVLKRLKIYNYAGAGGYLHIGTGAAGAFVDALPALYHVNALNTDFVEFDLPEVEFSTDIMGWSSAVSIDVQVEVEEIS